MNDSAEVPQADIPVWQRAHDTLNAIHQDMEYRAKEIEAQMNRLHGEREAILHVLSRISTPPPQPANVTNYAAASQPVLSRW